MRNACAPLANAYDAVAEYLRRISPDVLNKYDKIRGYLPFFKQVRVLLQWTLCTAVHSGPNLQPLYREDHCIERYFALRHAVRAAT